MPFHKHFLAASSAEAVADIDADKALPASVHAILKTAIEALPGDGPLSVQAHGHFAGPGASVDDRMSQSSWLAEVRVMPLTQEGYDEAKAHEAANAES